MENKAPFTKKIIGLAILLIKLLTGPLVSVVISLANCAFTKMVTEQAKEANPKATFFWDMPFHNVTLNPTDLSFALKSKDKQGLYLTSGSRPEDDILEPRKLLIINNKTGLATTTVLMKIFLKPQKQIRFLKALIRWLFLEDLLQPLPDYMLE